MAETAETPTPRSMEVRLTEYRDSLLSVADQMEELAGKVTAKGGNPAPLTDAARLYRTIGEDITKVIAGEELRPWAVTGVL